jgi:putative lipoprotein
MEVDMLHKRLVRIAQALLTLVALALPAAAEDITFSGEVSYRERIALPPGAQLRVTLVSLPGASPIAAATANIEARGGVPLQFVLDVRSAVIKPADRYGLMAEIRRHGRTLFRNLQAVPVDATMPAHTLITVALLPEPEGEAPIEARPAAASPLLDAVWMVTSVGGDPILPQSKVSFSITADQRVGGNGGCNSYFAEAEFEIQPLSIGPIAGTRMACAPEIMAQESRFFAALGAISGYEVAGNTLRLVDAAGIPLIGLVRQD